MFKPIPVIKPNADVKLVYVWRNTMVMVFNHMGQQIPELQDVDSPELRAKIQARSDSRTKWEFNAAWPSII